jgi:DNA polymerase sigma
MLRRQLAKTVRSAGFGPVIPITAAVSIVKATHRASGLNIDLNVNERLGYFNTQMISKYMELSPVLRPLVYFLKYWAKSHNLDFLTSYCYTIMTVGFLQVSALLVEASDCL